jgi:ferredoxin--NADP+ reductase
MPKITAAERLNDHYAIYEIDASDVASQASPGQIVLGSIGENSPTLPLPITAFDPERGTISLLAQTVADTDLEQTPVDVRGPFGGDSTAATNRVLCVTEGIGLGALLPRLQAYKSKNVYTIVVAGYHSAAHVFWRDRLDPLADELYIVTEDGSFGIKGPIRDTVKGICQHVPDIERIIAVGPLPMLKSCAKVATSVQIPISVSLAAAVEPGNGTTPTEALVAYDWNNTELDGLKTDFDELSRTLGLHPVK